MKIGNRDFSWGNFSQRVVSALQPGPKEDHRPKVTPSRSVFQPFGRGQTIQFSSEHQLRSIDIKLLEEISAQNLSYQGFISSHLQQLPADGESKQAIQRSLAIGKMLALLGETIQEIKAIELKRISNSKG